MHTCVRKEGGKHLLTNYIYASHIASLFLFFTCIKKDHHQNAFSSTIFFLITNLVLRFKSKVNTQIGIIERIYYIYRSCVYDSNKIVISMGLVSLARL